MNIRIILLGGLFLLGFFNLSGQAKIMQKANELYKQDRFSEAAEFYEVALTKKENLSAKTKLANCYRMNNRLNEAEKLYAEIVELPKAKSKTYFYYGEVLMSRGKYDEAKSWFLKYDKLESDDARGKLMAEACDKVKTIQPMFPYLKVEAWNQNSEADDSTPAIWGNGIVFSSDRKIGVKLMKEKSGWTGRDYLNLYYSKEDENGNWQGAKAFSAKLNELNKNTGNPSFTKDGKEIFFTRNSIQPSKRNVYNMQIFAAENGDGNRWKNVKALGFCSPEHNYMHPAIAPDGKWLVFVTDRRGGRGGTDLWGVRRTKDGWGRPQNMGEIINTPTNEGFPYFDESGRLFFCSKGHVGYGGFDVYMTERKEGGGWKKPINLGRPVNSPQDDISIFLNSGGASGMFTSNRHGGDDDIYLFDIVDSKEEAVFVDFRGERNEILNNEIVKKEKIGKNKEKASAKPKKEKEFNNADSSNQNVALNEKKVEREENVLTKVNQEKLGKKIEIVKEKVEEKLVKSVEINEEKPLEDIDIPNEKIEVIETAEKAVVEKKIEEQLVNPVRFSKEKLGKNIDARNEKIEVVVKKEIEEKIEKALNEAPQNETVEKVRPIEAIKENVSPKEESNDDRNELTNFFPNLNTSNLNIGNRFRIVNAVFDYQVYQLTPKIVIELNDIAILLKENPNLKIELAAHTDSFGTAIDNLKLSQNRATQAAVYLLSISVSGHQVVAKGYGESQLINHCSDDVECTMELHLVNQRMEMVVLGK